MPLPLEDYGLIGDANTAALVGRDGSLDWLSLPRFDSPAAFAALLGTEENGRWRIAPHDGDAPGTHRYLDDTLVLETTFTTPSGRVRLLDFMPLERERRTVVRIVEGIEGRVPMLLEFAPRFDYGELIPWLQVADTSVVAISGPGAVALHGPAPFVRDGRTIVGRFDAEAGKRQHFVMTAYPSHRLQPQPIDPDAALDATVEWWRAYAARCTYAGSDREAVMRSLLTLKALTYAPTGAIVAAPTTSLPEALRGVRNWDYRYCWLRDATFTLLALMSAGYHEEAGAFVRWLVRTIAGDPAKMQIMYGVAGERRLAEYELQLLRGYEDSRPVRIGNAASDQFQLDVYGEVIDAILAAMKGGAKLDEETWRMVQSIVGFVGEHWENPADNGMWEVRGGRKHFTHSKVMAWVAFDRVVTMIEEYGHEGPLTSYRETRDRIHAEICARSFDRARNAFVQYYGARQLDAAALLIPLVGFLPPEDPRIRGTLAAIERELFDDPFVLRYSTEPKANVDGLPEGEGAFLACSFWLADNYVLCERWDDARALFDKLLALRSPVGLLSEEYDVRARRLVGNFPQAFSHLALVNTALNLDRHRGPAKKRAESTAAP
ncbi:MAG: glycoside hydrolase family 15 protein [Candidatus Eremiobacteraeota bacterium]|nr:glycoside hydrolase family 15 protein [Candidatus Eremiobacteraeota bacterium]